MLCKLGHNYACTVKTPILQQKNPQIFGHIHVYQVVVDILIMYHHTPLAFLSMLLSLCSVLPTLLIQTYISHSTQTTIPLNSAATPS